MAALESAHRKMDAADVHVSSLLKATQEAYRLARLDRATKAFNPPGRSGNAAIYESADVMHRRMRNAYLNNPLIKRATNVYRDLVVGSGINAFSDPIDHTFGWSLDERPRAELEGSFNYALESDDLFAEWCESQCDAAGKASMAEMQAMSISENMQTGDILFLECMNPEPGRISPLCYQMIEREQIDQSKDRPFAPGQNAIVNGFEVNRSGRELGVWLFNDHPYDDWASSIDSQFVPANRYLHVFRASRPSQWAGATWMHANGQSALDRGTWFETELQTAVKAAKLAIIHKLKNPSLPLGFDSSDDPDPLGRPEIELGNSPLAAAVGIDEDVKIIESTRPNTKAGEFFDLIDHDFAGGVDLSYYSLTGRFDKTNYGGFRGAMNLEDAQIRPVQLWLGRRMLMPIRKRFNQLAVATGEITSISAQQFRREQRRYQRFDLIGPGRNLLEPAAENEAVLGQLRGGLTTLKIECARRGLHWIRVLRQISLENRITDWLQVVLDHSKGQGGQVEKNSRSTSGDDQQTDTEARQW